MPKMIVHKSILGWDDLLHFEEEREEDEELEIKEELWKYKIQ